MEDDSEESDDILKEYDGGNVNYGLDRRRKVGVTIFREVKSNMRGEGGLPGKGSVL